jgi:hypothetical protein
MNVFTKLKSLLGPKRTFRPYERFLLDELCEMLPASYALAVRSRISSINLVQRPADGREVNCYFIVRGKPVFTDDGRIPEISGETCLGKVFFRSREKENVASFWAIDGSFFSIEFKVTPENEQTDLQVIKKNLEFSP